MCPVSSPQGLLAAWRTESARQPLAMTAVLLYLGLPWGPCDLLYLCFPWGPCDLPPDVLWHHAARCRLLSAQSNRHIPPVLSIPVAPLRCVLLSANTPNTLMRYAMCLASLLQALLAAWRTELARQPLAMSEGDACKVLNLPPGADGVINEDDMRRAYRCAWGF